MTTLLCGAFELDDPKVNLLGVLLPPFLRIRAGRGNTSDQLRTLTQSIEAELKVSRPGEQAIVTRMAEVFLLRAIRDYVLSSSNGELGLPAISRDRSIGRVLGLIHRHPEHSWTVGTLAGATPQGYLQRYRFSKAVQLLRTTDAKLHEIAHSVGYDSESSFGKAFKRLMGKAPGAYR